MPSRIRTTHTNKGEMCWKVCLSKNETKPSKPPQPDCLIAVCPLDYLMLSTQLADPVQYIPKHTRVVHHSTWLPGSALLRKPAPAAAACTRKSVHTAPHKHPALCAPCHRPPVDPCLLAWCSSDTAPCPISCCGGSPMPTSYRAIPSSKGVVTIRPPPLLPLLFCPRPALTSR